MCRMLAVYAPTYKQAQEVLTAFRKQAHEAAPEKTDGAPSDHKDGWGLVSAAPDNVRYVARRAEDAGEDPYFLRALELLKNTPKDALYLCHFRNASRGDKRLENTHPFLAGGWAFAHNGTVEGHLEDPGAPYAGQTDSERFFLKLLKHMRVQPDFETALKRCISEIEANGRYTSLTFLMTDGNVLYGYRRIGQSLKGRRTHADLEKYYTLGVGKKGRATVVAQERTHLGELEEWQEVPDDGLLIWSKGRPVQIKALGLVATHNAN
jgi:predicted glutamine amidotransferase